MTPLDRTWLTLLGVLGTLVASLVPNAVPIAADRAFDAQVRASADAPSPTLYRSQHGSDGESFAHEGSPTIAFGQVALDPALLLARSSVGEDAGLLRRATLTGRARAPPA